ncbi:uncharacterized protein M421DRAFT_294998 [Didymella exigua CBS 183.55]|uniref:Uncharacterized protein n=1 Tax=Didymella exigua CBS 183.55 TaxID=1150837 RepID=A0A6A5R7Z0_9PLEO|nr:uncharacterized protein M421DRAFT_294998 [Didymella exigua CBS 183.55]KAF1924295.1 hypothetical protein M421DRAFT_294998 [Didymella exigua CBS 183.55]
MGRHEDDHCGIGEIVSFANPQNHDRHQGDGGTESFPQPRHPYLSPPQRTCIFFDALHEYEWEDGTESCLFSFSSLGDAPRNLIRTLAVNVSQPDALQAWLDNDSASQITHLFIHCPAIDDAPTRHVWYRLLDRLGREALHLQDLQAYWDWEYVSTELTLDGMNENLPFVRGPGASRPKRTYTLHGFYAKHWLVYLESRIAVRAINPQIYIALTRENGWARFEEVSGEDRVVDILIKLDCCRYAYETNYGIDLDWMNVIEQS